MAYIRVKKAKRKNGTFCEYAYIVETKRYKKKKIKQRSKKYLGKVFRPEKSNSFKFAEFHKIDDLDDYIEKSSPEKIIRDCIVLELVNHGFIEEKGKLRNGDCIFDIRRRKVNAKNANAAVMMNEGCFTTYTLRNLLNFKPVSEEDGYAYAKLFVDVGIAIQPELFVGVFSKFYK